MIGLEDLSIELMTHYTTLLPDRIGSGYCFPSFLFLSKYWQDTSGEDNFSQSLCLSCPLITHISPSTARALFASALCQMKDDEKKAVIEYWERFCLYSFDFVSACLMSVFLTLIFLLQYQLPVTLNLSDSKSWPARLLSLL